MVSFTGEQAASIAAIEQLVTIWADVLDQDNGLDKTRGVGFLTDDCRYNVAGKWREGRDEIVAFYADRRAGLGDGLPVIRHTVSNFRILFTGKDSAKMNFLLLYFADNAGGNPADPLAVADCRMEFRCDAAGDWLISRFDSEQVIKRHG
jgi:hypothetical protein